MKDIKKWLRSPSDDQTEFNEKETEVLLHELNIATIFGVAAKFSTTAKYHGCGEYTLNVSSIKKESIS